MRKLVIGIIIFFALVLGIGISYSAYSVWQDPDLLPIKRVQVEGSFNYVSQQEITQKVLPFVQNGFLKVDVSAVREALMADQALKEVRIVRIWPDALWIEALEHHFVARWRDPVTQKLALLTSEGNIVEISPNANDATLPLVICSNSQVKSVLVMLTELNTVFKEINTQVIELALDERHALTAKLDNEWVLFLGKDSSLSRAQRLVGSYEKLISKITGKINYIDLRYTNGIAVKMDKM